MHLGGAGKLFYICTAQEFFRKSEALERRVHPSCSKKYGSASCLKSVYSPSFHFISHFLFHLILHYRGIS